MTTLSMDSCSAPSGSRPAGAVRWLAQLLCGTFMLGVVALLAVGVAVPRITGATPYVILTSSMRPTLPPGTLVISRPVDPADIGIGDVITYQLRSGEPEVVTHRVDGVSYTTGGEYVFTTKGDANDLPDAAPVRTVQVRGESWYAIPYLGHATSLLDPHTRRLIGWAVGGALLAQGLWWLGEAFLNRRRRGPA
jgi:signal peptidase